MNIMRERDKNNTKHGTPVLLFLMDRSQKKSDIREVTNYIF
jgi:hypothetical protein